MAIAQLKVPADRLTAWTDYDGLVQLISVDGQRTVGCPYWDLVGDVDALQLRDLYRDMAIVRRIDAEAMALQRQGELGLWAPLLGQEAAQVGSARALRRDDFAVTSYREHGVAYCRGVDPVAMLRMWRGSGLSGWDPAAYNIATPAIVVGSQALHATGYALGITLDAADAAVLAYFGDGATSEGDVSEALGFAASFMVPVVFFCQNNQWAISEPVRLQSHATIAQRAEGFGIPGRAGRRQRRAGRARRHPPRPRPRLRRTGPDADRGGDVPDGAAHDVGRSDALPLTCRGRGVAGQGPAGPAALAAAQRGPGRRRVRTGRLDGSGSRWRRRCARASSICPTPNRRALFEHVYAGTTH